MTRTLQREEVYKILDNERTYQDVKWSETGTSSQRGNGDRSVDEFSLYIKHYADELVRIATTSLDPMAKLDIMRKIGGLCVAAMEQHGARRR